MFEKPNLNAKQARWMKFLSDFYFEVRHVKGKENNFIDSLSRKNSCESYKRFPIRFKNKRF